jgi:hypothetical protein
MKTKINYSIPCWQRPKDICYRFGLKRTYLFNLLRNNKIESRLISPRVRVISIASIENFLDSSDK